MRESLFDIEYLDIDLADSLLSKPLFARELAPKLERDPNYLAWWNRDSMNEAILTQLADTTVKNDYGEYDNLDFIVKSHWSKQKGTGKSSLTMSCKIYYDEVLIPDNGFVIDEYFFTVSEKLKYHREKAGQLEQRFFVLDEQVPAIGQSSQANLMRMLRIDDTTRVRGFNNAYVSPRGIELFSHDYFLEAVMLDEKNQTIIACVRARDRTALGWMGFPRPPLKYWKEYQKKKLEFTKQLEEGQIVRMEFDWLYDKVEEMFHMERKYREELDYFEEFKEWHEGGQKGLKPMKPRVQVTPARIRDWAVACNPELTSQELETAKEVIYEMLREKVEGGDSNEEGSLA